MLKNIPLVLNKVLFFFMIRLPLKKTVQQVAEIMATWATANSFFSLFVLNKKSTKIVLEKKKKIEKTCFQSALI